ncbi:MAG: hypothetical protein PF572_05730 [Patescibacteria group bacterium]|jgi:hypothetical protein|nr:hypothetical protein [Patescibacteria group bacterium]
MLINKECIELLESFFAYKPDMEIELKGEFENNQFKSFLKRLEGRKLIKNLEISNIPKTEAYKIKFEIVDWAELESFAQYTFDDLIEEPYGINRQLSIVADRILEKAIELDSIIFTVTEADFEQYEREHIQFLKTFEILEKQKFLFQRESTYYLTDQSFSFRILLFKNLDDHKKELNKEVIKKSKKENEKQKLVFENGILKGGWSNSELRIKSENSFEYQLLSVALNSPLGEKIDCSTESIDIPKFQKIYDTALRLNKKIEKSLGIKDFFDIDYSNKNIMRTVE